MVILNRTAWTLGVAKASNPIAAITAKNLEFFIG